MVKTRFAPSPTGYIHIGSIRTALYSYAFARKNKGKFILRIEDTDKKREVEDGIKDIVDSLDVFRLKFDEGPGIGGPNSPYIQSERLSIYKKKAEELVKDKKAYYCFCTEERLKKMRDKMQRRGEKPMYDRKCRELSMEESKMRIEKGENYVIRLKVPDGRKLEIEDKVMGKVRWNSDEVDDQILLKSDGFPTYHLAVVVDDVLMGITHITRGIEWLASVPKHILLFEAFQYKIPIMAHMPVILDPGGGKLSKRKGVVAVKDFLKQGYIPEALLNFLMLLGWAPDDDREFFSLAEFVKEFDLDSLNKSSPVFDRKKLTWFNGEYIRKVSKKLLSQQFINWAQEYLEDKKLLEKINEDQNLVDKITLVQERVSLLSEIADAIRFFYEHMSTPDPSGVKGVKRYDKKHYPEAMKDYIQILKDYDNDTGKWDKDSWVSDIRSLADKYEWKHGDMFMLLRLIVCGNSISPPLFESLLILGKERILKRLESFVSKP